MSENKDINNSVILTAEITNMALSLDEDGIRDNPKKAKEMFDKIAENSKILGTELAKDPHKNDPSIKYDLSDDDPVRIKLENDLVKIMFDPKRGSGNWFNSAWPVLRDYVKMTNKKLFRKL